MTFKIVVRPTALAVSMQEAQSNARADVGSDGTSALDADIVRAIRTYTAEAETETNRLIMEQTWELTLDAFPAERSIKLYKPPLLAVDWVKFYDVNGEQRTLDPADYQADVKTDPGYVVLKPGRAWPATADMIGAVEVRFRCGYGANASAVPDGISGFILARVQEHFETGGQPKNEYIRRLLWSEVYYA
ncbi:head-tail connector protein [Massilia phyllosphaerae]|uniref:head-tail connector protein n=1 Tax=Massilia phyllosphaerae TaxID=3106034 RepID=UPI002B1CBB9A|nr:hypothetical protein [Massilia sp. SGZ-792]